MTEGDTYQRRLTDQVAHGALWTILAAAINKVVTLGGQVLLAWLLVPQDMGLVAMAMSVCAIMSVFSMVGAGNILVQRQREFDSVAGDVFWLSLTVNTVAGLAVAALAPVAGVIFRDPRVTPLVLLIAPTFPLQSLPTVYAARLQIGLRFRVLNVIYLGAGILRTVSSVLLAWAGFGAYSLVLPLLWVPILSAAAQRLAAGRVRIGRPRIALQTSILAPLLWVSLQPFVEGLQANGSNFVLGILESPQTTGWYFWGAQISSQALFLLALNLGQVLFPGLARLDESRERQRDAFLRALRILLIAALPACVLQTLLARPLIELLFPGRWLGAVPAVQWLSAGMLTLPAGVVGSALIRARGRFGLLCVLTAAHGFLVVCCTTIGCLIGDASAIAAWTAAAMLVGNTGIGVAAAIICGAGARPFVRLMAVLAVAGIAETAVAVVPATCIAGSPLRIVSTAAVVGMLHFIVTRALAPETFGMARGFLRRQRHAD